RGCHRERRGCRCAWCSFLGSGALPTGDGWLSRRKLDRQVHDLAQTLAERDDVAFGELVRRDPAVPLPQRDPQLQPGEVGADAAVHARAEGEVLVRGTGEVDDVRVVV